MMWGWIDALDIVTLTKIFKCLSCKFVAHFSKWYVRDPNRHRTSLNFDSVFKPCLFLSEHPSSILNRHQQLLTYTDHHNQYEILTMLTSCVPKTQCYVWIFQLWNLTDSAFVIFLWSLYPKPSYLKLNLWLHCIVTWM